MNSKINSKKTTFSGSVGFVLVAAGSAVGVGNIWRFPYLCAKNGGGLFLAVYLVLVLTFGFALLITDIAIGRKTKDHVVNAYSKIKSKWKPLGIATFAVPCLIMTYYPVIGGWITKYIVEYTISDGAAAAGDGFFTSFITSNSSIAYTMVFLILTAAIVLSGVEKGIEKCSKYIMPALLLLIIGLTVYALTLKETVNGETRTGIEGLVYFLKPDLAHLTVKSFFDAVIDAMGQLFFSLSVGMGIMITYGSYVKDDVDLIKSTNQIEIFDTGVAVLAGMMIVPIVYVFLGTDGMSAGPGLTFISMPKVFAVMGPIGKYLGFAFFLALGFAALTSCISVMETIVANFMEIFDTSRKKVSIITAVIAAVAAAAICLGYSGLYFEIILPNGAAAQLLDLVDYVSNNVLMPLVALFSAIFVGWVVEPDFVISEAVRNGETFNREKMYRITIKYVIPVMMLILFATSSGLVG